MGKPMKFRSLIERELKIVNRCIFCGKSISQGKVICSKCDNGRFTLLKKSIKGRR